MSILFPKTIMSILSYIFSLILSALSVFANPAASSKAMPEIPDDFTPVVRFAVASDMHNETERVKDMIAKSYSLAEGSDSSYKALDAFCFCGDFTNAGSRDEMQAMYDVMSTSIHEGTQLVNILGNHEPKTYTPDVMDETYTSIFGVEPNVHYVINGFHFIGISCHDGDKMSASSIQWLKQQLKDAEKDNPNAPIFVFQHPHNFGTVYGSVNWGNTQLNTILSQYPQVVDFSGHSHYPMNDPRSIWQGTYTALGTGSMYYLELENELSAGHFPEGNDDVAEFYIVEVNAEGSVAVRCYNLISDSYFGEEYYIETPADKSTFAYTYKNRMESDSAPVFPENAEVGTSVADDGSISISFPAASDTYIVHDYKVVVKNALGVPVSEKSYLSDYYHVTTKDVVSIEVGTIDGLFDGKTYSVEVYAQNAYTIQSKPITGEFTAP